MLWIGMVIGFSGGFLCAIQWKIVDPRTRRERRRDRRRNRRQQLSDKRRGLDDHLGIESVRSFRLWRPA